MGAYKLPPLARTVMVGSTGYRRGDTPPLHHARKIKNPKNWQGGKVPDFDLFAAGGDADLQGQGEGSGEGGPVTPDVETPIVVPPNATETWPPAVQETGDVVTGSEGAGTDTDDEQDPPEPEPEAELEQDPVPAGDTAPQQDGDAAADTQSRKSRPRRGRSGGE